MSGASVSTPTAIANRYAASTAGESRIPIIDIGALFGNDRAAIVETAMRARAACEDIGFLYVSGHGVPESVVEGALAQAEAFFAQPEEMKLQYDIGKIKRHKGYVPLGALSADPEKVDVQEGYEVGFELPADDPDYLSGKSRLYGPNVWPRELPRFRPDVYAYFEAMLALGRRMFKLFAIALDMPDDYFEPMITKPLAQLRLIHYPETRPRKESEGVVGIGAHTDYECFTILWQDQEGLQVQTTGGDWIQATPIPGTFVINISDMMMRMTNDRFVSTPHRVISLTGRERFSFPFFFGANHDVVFECLPSCCGPDNPPRYPPTHNGMWIENMHTYSYVYRHEERGKLDPAERDAP